MGTKALDDARLLHGCRGRPTSATGMQSPHSSAASQRVEADHAACPMARSHVGERLFNVINTDPPRNQRLQIESSAESQLGENCNVARGIACAIDAAADRLPVSHQ